MAPAGGNEYIKALGDGFLAEQHHRSCRMSHTHIHSVYELYFCPAPIAHRYVLCNRDYTTDRPSAVLIRPYTIHSMFATTPWPQGKRWYVFSFSEATAARVGMDSLLAEMLGDELGILMELPEDQTAHLEQILQFFFDPEHPLEELDALSLFAFFLRRLRKATALGTQQGSGSAGGCVQQVMQHICRNFHTPLSTEALARQFSVSRSKLDRDFKNAIGVTPKDFIELCRLHCAKKLLKTEKQMKISTVAQLCGFPSENYFYRFFRTHTGMTPTQYKIGAAKDGHI